MEQFELKASNRKGDERGICVHLDAKSLTDEQWVLTLEAAGAIHLNSPRLGFMGTWLLDGARVIEPVCPATGLPYFSLTFAHAAEVLHDLGGIACFSTQKPSEIEWAARGSDGEQGSTGSIAGAAVPPLAGADSAADGLTLWMEVVLGDKQVSATVSGVNVDHLHYGFSALRHALALDRS